jgi:hypothetical protein
VYVLTRPECHNIGQVSTWSDLDKLPVAMIDASMKLVAASLDEGLFT